MHLLNEFEGWPVLQALHLNESNFDWFESYIKLRQIGLIDNSLISIFVESDDKNSSKRVLYVRNKLILIINVFEFNFILKHAQLDQPSFGLYDRDLLLKGVNDSSVLAYYDLMVKSAVLLGANQKIAKKQMMEVLEFETLLANVDN